MTHGGTHYAGAAGIVAATLTSLAIPAEALGWEWRILLTVPVTATGFFTTLALNQILKWWQGRKKP